MLIRGSQIENHKLYNPYRAGIIPFYREGRRILFALSLQHPVGDIADFGGHSENYDMSLLVTALREYQEESYNCFGSFTLQDLYDSWAIITPQTIEFLLPCSYPPSLVDKKFSRLREEGGEVIEIIWTSEPYRLLPLLYQPLVVVVGSLYENMVVEKLREKYD